MKKPDTTLIDQDWPADELEEVNNCPYCGSAQRTIAYKNVQDWSFYCAPGKWTYWNCEKCQALYLNPRPTKISMGKAYRIYYTHNKSKLNQLYSAARERVRNECWFAWYQICITPRMNLPKALYWILQPFKRQLTEPFIQLQLSKLPKGKLLDIGCGNGKVMGHAQQLGWQAIGIEIDPEAVRAATIVGLNVLQVNFDQIHQFTEQFDCVICSHVLEHLHQPLDLIIRINQVLKPGGYVILVLPNALSNVRMRYGRYWRGLEAPRHLGIPTSLGLLNAMKQQGFETSIMNTSHTETLKESKKFEKKIHKFKLSELLLSKFYLYKKQQNIKIMESDFTKIIARKI